MTWLKDPSQFQEMREREGGNNISGLKKSIWFLPVFLTLPGEKQRNKQTKTLENFKVLARIWHKRTGKRGTLVWSPDGGSEVSRQQISNTQKDDRTAMGSLIHSLININGAISICQAPHWGLRILLWIKSSRILALRKLSCGSGRVDKIITVISLWLQTEIGDMKKERNGIEKHR